MPPLFSQSPTGLFAGRLFLALVPGGTPLVAAEGAVHLSRRKAGVGAGQEAGEAPGRNSKRYGCVLYRSIAACGGMGQFCSH